MIAERLSRLAILAVCAQTLTLTLTAPMALADCRDDRVEIRGDAGIQRFRVELAETAAERARGLMFRETMPTGAGMLFIYEAPQLSTNFWMQNTLIPLDIIFMDATGTVKTVQEMAKPLDTTPLPGGPGIQYVLEINGGLAERMGIAPGSELRHPSILPSLAAWPCGDDAVTREQEPGEEGAPGAQDTQAETPADAASPTAESNEAGAAGSAPEDRGEEPPAAPPPPVPQVTDQELPPAGE